MSFSFKGLPSAESDEPPQEALDEGVYRESNQRAMKRIAARFDEEIAQVQKEFQAEKPTKQTKE